MNTHQKIVMNMDMDMDNLKFGVRVYCLDDMTVSGIVSSIDRTVTPEQITFTCDGSNKSITKSIDNITDDFHFIYRSLVERNRELENDVSDLRSSYWNINQQLIRMNSNS